jgi:hypothetical protein
MNSHKEKIMKLRSAVVLLGIPLFAVVASAHNGLEHVMGTVKSVSATSITVETADKPPKRVAVAILPTTTFQKDGADTTVKSLNVGDRVVIHAKPDGNKLDAVTVEFGKMAAMPNMPGMKMPQ